MKFGKYANRVFSSNANPFVKFDMKKVFFNEGIQHIFDKTWSKKVHINISGSRFCNRSGAFNKFLDCLNRNEVQVLKASGCDIFHFEDIMKVLKPDVIKEIDLSNNKVMLEDMMAFGMFCEKARSLEAIKFGGNSEEWQDTANFFLCLQGAKSLKKIEFEGEFRSEFLEKFAAKSRDLLAVNKNITEFKTNLFSVNEYLSRQFQDRTIGR